ncbi:DJ-1 family glyoxalase III [Clostridium sp.]|uniref:DJ-1 family glyoxalase III n=1 Tax=Clostridium sp. TaxID=1506 RepID=UPI00260A51BA|nr:DJ-1 family glyoxalase III [Clostridium sp.]
MKKVAILLANGFETLEGLTVIDILRRAKVTVDTFSVENNEVETSHKIKIKADKNIDDKEIEEYDILVLPGGIPGATTLRDDDRVIKLVKEFNEKGKTICAICAAPIVLGKAGITEGLNITCYPGFEDEIGNVNYKEDLVVIDKNIITGKAVSAAIPFAFEILNLVAPEKVDKIKKSMLLNF